MTQRHCTCPRERARHRRHNAASDAAGAEPRRRKRGAAGSLMGLGLDRFHQFISVLDSSVASLCRELANKIPTSLQNCILSTLFTAMTENKQHHFLASQSWDGEDGNQVGF